METIVSLALPAPWASGKTQMESYIPGISKMAKCQITMKNNKS